MTDPRRLALEAAAAVVEGVAWATGGATEAAIAQVVMARLYERLGRLIGSSGLDALLGRALRLAQAKDPALANVRVEEGGCLVGLDHDSVDSRQALTAVLAQVFELLVRFVGEDLAMRMIRDVERTTE